LPTGDAVVVYAAAHPSKAGVLAELVSGSVSGELDGMLRLPGSSMFALALRSTPESRRRTATELTAQLEAFLGDRLEAAQRASLERTLSHLAEGRGDELAVSFELVPKPLLVVRGALRDREVLGAAFSGLVEALSFRAVAEPLSAAVGPVRAGRPRADDRGGSATVAIGPGGRTTAEIRWEFFESEYELRAGIAPLGPNDGPTLVKDPALPAMLERQAPASAALALRVAVAPEGVQGSAPWALVSAGSKGGRGFLRGELPAPLFAFLVKQAVLEGPSRSPAP
jgi:hypothetical protein